jgi:phosphatidylserine/phosphatidylglycerophosphate/cardiolipin synthase-like enzyme
VLLGVLALTGCTRVGPEPLTGSGGTDMAMSGQSGDDGGAMQGPGSADFARPGAPRDMAMPPPVTSGVQIIVEPSDHGQALVDAISGAKQSVHMTMYLLSNKAVIDALTGLRQATPAREVKVILNQTFPDTSTSNQAVFDQLQAAGVSVVWASSRFTYTHEKCVIIDGKQAWIMSMNATASSPTSNREYLAVDNNAADVAEADAIFAADFANQAITPTGSLVVAPVNARDRLVALINGAAHTLDLELEELSDTQVTAALTARADAGVPVRIVLANDTTPAAAQQTAITTLKAHHVKLVSLVTPYIHAKAIVADGATVYVGSENLTTNSLLSNRELGIILSTASEVQKVATTIASDFAAGTAL